MVWRKTTSISVGKWTYLDLVSARRPVPHLNQSDSNKNEVKRFFLHCLIQTLKLTVRLAVHELRKKGILVYISSGSLSLITSLFSLLKKIFYAEELRKSEEKIFIISKIYYVIYIQKTMFSEILLHISENIIFWIWIHFFRNTLMNNYKYN